MVTILGQTTEGRDAETYKVELIDQDGRSITGYLKLTDDPRKLIAELAAAQLGRALGLSVPRPLLAILDTADLRPEFRSAFAHKGHMICFASQQTSKRSYSLERGFNDCGAQVADALEAQFDMPAAIAFDELIANDDRNLGNIMFSPESRKFWLIDHGRALTGSYWKLWGLSDPAVSVGNVLAENAAKVWDDHLKKKAAERANDLAKQCATLCLDDLDLDGHFAKIDPTTDRQEIIQFLRARLYHMVPLICRRLNIGQACLMLPAGS